MSLVVKLICRNIFFLSLILIPVLDAKRDKREWEPVYSANPGGKYASITFDDGPHAVLTPRLLDIFKKKKCKATFFVMGIKAKLHPDILKRMKDEGHEVANHSWDHPVLSHITPGELHNQMESTTTAIYQATNFTPVVMRPPYGNSNNKVNKQIYKDENLTVIMWSIDPKDWARPPQETVKNNILEKFKSGSIILMHDVHPGTITLMPSLLDELLVKGFQLVTVSEMIQLDKINKLKTRKMLRGG